MTYTPYTFNDRIIPKFFPNIPKILFNIYFKFTINFIQNLSQIPSKVFF